MKITLLGFLLGLLLVALPVYMAYALRLGMMRRLLVSFGRMMLMTALVGGMLMLVIGVNQTWLTIVVGLLMMVLGAMLTASRSSIPLSRSLVPVAVGTLASVTIIALYVLFLVFGLRNPFEVRYFIPVVGLLVGCTISINVKALNTYYSGLVYHHQLYNYLLGNGATHHEAVNYFMRRSFQSALLPVTRQMSGTVVSTAPVLLLALVLGGTDVWTATALQVLLFGLVLCVSLTSLALTLLVGRRYLFDGYERLYGKRSKSSVAPAASVSVADTVREDESSTPVDV